jgi:hypothetical protein
VIYGNFLGNYKAEIKKTLKEQFKIYNILEVSNELEAIGGKHAVHAGMLPCAASHFMARYLYIPIIF